MTRIIAGLAGSLALKVPPAGTRPTSDRVRESLFAALEAAGELDGAIVLDGYAGSGALGLESASRGAAQVVLVERAAKAASVCRQNAALVAKSGAVKANVVERPVLSYLQTPVGPFSLVFLDPPYDLSEAEVSAVLEALAPRLTDDALIVVERAKRSPEPAWPEGVQLERHKNYGDTTAWFARSKG